ncbi:MAG: alpha/beta fold hydrolase [Proteobacteria bacterium]|nr:alpha/beta fold hydrolase [Pseudomonadota bacterium]
MSDNSSPKMLQSETLRTRIAYDYVPGNSQKPVLMFLHGLHSGMESSKCIHGMALAARLGLGAVRFDYPCHGASDGEFVDFTIGQALQAAKDVVAHIDRPVVVVGSSTGAWVALLLAHALPDKVRGIVTVANACDFTERLYWDPLSDEEKQDWQTSGVRVEPADEGEIWQIGYTLVDEGRRHMLLEGDKLAAVTCPARLLHGMADDVVPWHFSTDVAEKLGGADVKVELVKDADHRFKREGDLALMEQAIFSLPVW